MTDLTMHEKKQMFDEIADAASNLEIEIEANSQLYLQRFSEETKNIAQKYSLAQDSLDEFLSEYRNQYMTDLEKRQAFMNQWGYKEAPRLKDSLEESMKYGIGGFITGLFIDLVTFILTSPFQQYEEMDQIGLIYVGAMIFSSLIGSSCGYINAKETNELISNTEGYQQVMEFYDKKEAIFAKHFDKTYSIID